MTSATTPKVVILGGHFQQREAIAAAAIIPGMLVALNASGQVTPHAEAGEIGAIGVADMYQLTGRGLDDAYAKDDQAIYQIPADGSSFNGILAAGQNVAGGAALTSNGDGRLKAAAAGDFVYGYARDAVNASAAAARVRVLSAKGRTATAGE